MFSSRFIVSVNPGLDGTILLTGFKLCHCFHIPIVAYIPGNEKVDKK